MKWMWLLLLALVAACQPAAQAPAPQVALWTVTAPDGRVAGFLMGTVHALPPGTHWRRAAIDRAMADAGRLVLEIGEPLNADVAGKALARLALTPGLPPPSARLDPGGRAALIGAYRKLGLTDAQFANQESWAVALQIAAIATQRAGALADAGVEPQLRGLMPGKPVTGLETIDSQFGIFDALPDRAQNRLLADTARDAASAQSDDADVLAQWLKGDELGLAAQTTRDFLADPVLHEALLTARNRAWTVQIDALLRAHTRPFIAVGADHVVGRDGLPAMLRARGWTVTRAW